MEALKGPQGSKVHKRSAHTRPAQLITVMPALTPMSELEEAVAPPRALTLQGKMFRSACVLSEAHSCVQSGSSKSNGGKVEGSTGSVYCSVTAPFLK